MKSSGWVRLLISAVALLALCAVTGCEPAERSQPTTRPSPTNPDEVSVPVDGWYSWALRNRATGALIGSDDAGTATNNTESMIKLWIGTDWLTNAEATGYQPTEEEQEALRAMIRDSDDFAAERFWWERGGPEVIHRLVTECGLTNTTVSDLGWAYTQMTPADATLMMDCVLRRATGSPWTAWLVNEAQHVSVEGSFGIAPALPEGTTVTLKNGWTPHGDTGVWNLNCLASWDAWVLAVETRYPVEYGEEYGATICATVTKQLFQAQE